MRLPLLPNILRNMPANVNIDPIAIIATASIMTKMLPKSPNELYSPRPHITNEYTAKKNTAIPTTISIAPMNVAPGMYFASIGLPPSFSMCADTAADIKRMAVKGFFSAQYHHGRLPSVLIRSLYSFASLYESNMHQTHMTRTITANSISPNTPRATARTMRPKNRMKG